MSSDAVSPATADRTRKHSTILILGQELRPLEPIARMAEVLGLGRTTAFNVSDTWPLLGHKNARKVIVPALAEQLGIPYEVIVTEIPYEDCDDEVDE